MQRNNTDCAICCISLATGIPYDEVMAAADGIYNVDRGTTDTLAVLKNLAISHKVIFGEVSGKSLVSFKDKVDPLTGRTICHMMYYDGEDYHDPANNPRQWDEIYRIIEL